MSFHLRSLRWFLYVLLVCGGAVLLPAWKFEVAIAQSTTSEAQKAKANQLLQQGIQQFQTSQFREALQSGEQALQIYREIGDRQGESAALGNLGNAYDALGQYEQAIDFQQQSLAVKRKLGDRRGEANSLGNLGAAYQALGQYNQAIDFQQQSLAIKRKLGDRRGEANSLGNLGLAYQALGQYNQAIDYQQQYLALAREIGDRQGESAALGNLGNAYQALGQYNQAIDFYQQSLAIFREVGDRQGETIFLGNLGAVHKSLGQYNQAIDFLQQSLAIAREIGARPKEADVLGNLGSDYNALGQYEQVIDFYQQQLAINRGIGARPGEANALGNLGNAYDALGQYEQAIDFQQQSLAIDREIGDRLGEAVALGNLGNAYDALGQYEQAIDFQQQSLAIAREIGYREAEGIILGNIGLSLKKQKQSELAIVFFKQSVNVAEAIRKDNRGLSQDLQQSYTETVSNTYRGLADLLLQKNRVLEAQQVLDLLKVQELDDYLRNVRGNAQTASGVEYWQPEQKILDLYQEVIAEGEELVQLRDLSYSELTPAQKARLDQLTAREGELLTSFTDFTRYPEVVAAIDQLRTTTQGQAIEIANLRTLKDNLASLQQNAVLLYPLILEDRLELVLVTSKADVPIRVPVSVTCAELNRVILQFRTALQDPDQDAKPAAQQLYNWLIRPLKPYLTAAEAKTIVYSPDGALRYIPLAALHDGKDWLIQHYAVTHITAASLTQFDATPRSDLRLLAAACAQCNFSFQVGDRPFSFPNLPFARTEVERLAGEVPGTETLIDSAFSPADLVKRLASYTIVHLATHAAFVQGTPEESFIVFGNGDRVTLRDIPRWNLKNADLIVLSACETGLGGLQLGEQAEGQTGGRSVAPPSNGVEILGFGYQMQQAGAKAAIATLWQVSDGGTQVLMDTFYRSLQDTNSQDGMSKTEALRQAQIALITGDFSVLRIPRGSTIEIISTRTGLSAQVSSKLDHPYYWAPFILIGNGL